MNRRQRNENVCGKKRLPNSSHLYTHMLGTQRIQCQTYGNCVCHAIAVAKVCVSFEARVAKQKYIENFIFIPFQWIYRSVCWARWNTWNTRKKCQKTHIRSLSIMWTGEKDECKILRTIPKDLPREREREREIHTTKTFSKAKMKWNMKAFFVSILFIPD